MFWYVVCLRMLFSIWLVGFLVFLVGCLWMVDCVCDMRWWVVLILLIVLLFILLWFIMFVRLVGVSFICVVDLLVVCLLVGCTCCWVV